MAEPGVQASFIPKDAGQAAPIPRRRDSGGMGELLLLLAIVAFVASAALAGAVFLYEQYLQSSASSKQEQLRRAKEAFEPQLIQDLTRLDDRMHVAEELLGSHIAPSAFFTALGAATLQTVAFDDLDFSAEDPGNMTIKMTGVAQSVNSIALQADLFSKNGVIKDPIFSNIDRGEKGVSFDLDAVVNPAAINYVQLISGTAALQTQLPVSQPNGSEASQGPTSSGVQDAAQQQSVGPNPAQNPAAPAAQPSSSR